MNAEARGGGISVVIVVPSFAGGEQRDEAEIRCGVVEVLLSERVIRAVNHGVQENINAGLNEERDSTPQRAKQKHEDTNADQHSDKPKSK